MIIREYLCIVHRINQNDQPLTAQGLTPMTPRTNLCPGKEVPPICEDQYHWVKYSLGSCVNLEGSDHDVVGIYSG
jgi:hypothetical protein